MDSAFLGLKKKKKKKPVRSTKFWTFLVHTCFSSVCRFFCFSYWCLLCNGLLWFNLRIIWISTIPVNGLSGVVFLWRCWQVEGDFAEEENAESVVVVQGTAFQFVSAIPLYSNLHMVFSFISSVLVRGLLGINMFGFAGVTLEVCMSPKENPRRQLMN